MKNSSKILNSLQAVFLILLIICLIDSCATTTKVTMTPEQQSIRVLNGDQATTLDLMNTHTPIITEKFPSEIAARTRAVALNANVAQLIVHSNYSITYRFWKLK
jgi:hypothetical protein